MTDATKTSVNDDQDPTVGTAPAKAAPADAPKPPVKTAPAAKPKGR